MGLLIASGVLAFLAWCLTDTSLKPEHVCNSRGEITVRRILAVVSVQIVLWMLVCVFAFPIMRHLPRFLVTGWRLPLTVVTAEFWRWFALLMILQYLWMLVGTTVKTAAVFVMAKFGSQSAIQSLDEAPWRFLEVEPRRHPSSRSELEEQPMINEKASRALQRRRKKKAGYSGQWD
jgi:hypothetical protein